MDPVTIWLLVLATLWLLRMLVEELVAAVSGRESPRLARREAREKLAEQHGTPTVGQAITNRLARRIENPPERRWAAEWRAFLAELTADAVAEARVRHHVNMRARARRRAQRTHPWTAQTGGSTTPPRPEPQPEPADEVMAEYCRGGGCTTLVVPPEEMCGPCEKKDAAGPPTDPIPPVPPTDRAPNREEPPMAEGQHHEINADVRDPRTALAFAKSCRDFNDGVVGQLDILSVNMDRVGVGHAPIDEIRVLMDDARNYSRSNERSVTKYADHVVTQAEIAGDDDVAGTVRRTYLDTHGSDAGDPPKGSGGAHTIRAADCDTPAAAERFMNAVAQAYAAMKISVDQVMGAHQRQGVTDEPIAFLKEQLDLATVISNKAERAAATFRRHIRKRDDTVGKDESLHNTQSGKYLDPAKA